MNLNHENSNFDITINTISCWYPVKLNFKNPIIKSVNKYFNKETNEMFFMIRFIADNKTYMEKAKKKC